MRTSGLAALLLGLGCEIGALSPAAGGSAPEQVTSDTLAYCLHLADRLEQMKQAMENPPAQVDHLSVVGKQMCEQGKTRGGILRLRSAIVLLMHPSAGDTDPGTVRMGRSE